MPQYPTDLTEKQWQVIKKIITPQERKRKHSLRDTSLSFKAYSPDTGIILVTEACPEKSNEIKAVPALVDKIDISGKTVMADAMSMQKDIIDKIREKGGNFLIELKANQRALRYGVEDRLKSVPRYILTLKVRSLGMEGLKPGHTHI